MRAPATRRDEHGHARCRTEQPECLTHLGVVSEDLLHQAEALRDHERAEGALKSPERDEHADGRRHGTGG
jgi:hypothetical protein